MNRKISFLILGISLAFNLAFLGMFVWHTTHKPPEPPEKHELAGIRKAFEANPRKIDRLRDDFFVQRKNFWNFLRSEDFNQTEADSLLKVMINKQMEMENIIGKKMIELRIKGELPPRGNPPRPMNDRQKRRRK